MNNGQITDVFFDLDHTLWDFDRNSALAFERVFRTHDIPLAVSEFIKEYEPINFNYWKLYREERITKAELRRGRFNDAFARFDMAFPLTTIDALSDAYIDELPKDNYLFDGTGEILDYLKSRYRLHIITNGFFEVQHLKLKNSGIATYFDTVMTSEEAGAKKPNPVIFHAALEQAAREPGNCVMIGDTFEADILGAEAVGMQVLFYNYRNETIPGQYAVVDELLEIKNHL